MPKTSTRILIHTVCVDPMSIYENPLLTSPNSYYISSSLSQSGIYLKNTRFFAKFGLVGILVDYSISETQTLFHIAPERYSWGRASAIFGGLFNNRALYFTTFKNGLTFSTKKYTGNFTSPHENLLRSSFQKTHPAHLVVILMQNLFSTTMIMVRHHITLSLSILFIHSSDL
jgi:hypothetical protein